MFEVCHDFQNTPLKLLWTSEIQTNGILKPLRCSVNSSYTKITSLLRLLK